ncbi:MAG: hypothetical protein ACFB03_11645 [Paracoccaceae bacterium]
MAEKKPDFDINAPAFVPKTNAAAPAPVTPPTPVIGIIYDGTDKGALSREFFLVEAETPNYRTVLPHGHITIDMQGSQNVSYTSRTGAKNGFVSTDQDWLAVQADSAPIYNAFLRYFGQI